MLNQKLLHEFMNRFYGYGDWNAPLWFVGMEEGGGNSEDEINRRLGAWDGTDNLADIREYHRKIGVPWFIQHPKIQSTWGKLIRIALAFEGRPTDTEAVRRYQRDELGKRTAIIELFPLPSPGTDRWLYSSIPEIATRDKYMALVGATRIATLRERIRAHRPVAVVFYGSGYRNYWAQISGVSFAKNDRFETGRNESTSFVIASHPVAHGVMNRDFEAIGSWLAAFESSVNK